MSRGNLRVLIADSNRYHALLLERELHQRFVSCVTSIFRSADKILDELARNSYTAVIIECGFGVNGRKNLSGVVRQAHKELPIILTAAPGSIQPPIEPRHRDITAYVHKDNTFHILIPQLISHLLEEGTFLRNGRVLRPRLNARRRADMINITASTLAHEINNPLMTIMGVTELLLNDNDGQDREVSEKIRVIRESAQRIKSALENLATLASPTLKSTAAGNLIDTSPARSTTESKN